MKKLLAFIIALGMLFVMMSCTQNAEKDNADSTTIGSAESFSETKADSYEASNDIGGGEITQRKYRQCYYRIFYQLTLLVDKDELDAWEKETLSHNPDETNEMVVKLFVQHFNISKEDFEKANLELAKVLYDPNSPLLSMNPQDYINQEMFELYNADIIYTFDDKIINEYYLSHDYPYCYESEFEEAVESGEYTPRTEIWVDIEQMEAELIAKYGEAEIVDETSSVPDEILSTDLSQAEITE